MPDDRSDRRQVERVAVAIAFRASVVAILCVVGALLAWRLRLVLLLIAISCFVAALLNPAVALLTRRGFRRSAAVLSVYTVIALAAIGIGYTFFHTAIGQATHLAHALPGLVKQAQSGKGAVGRLLTRLHLASYVEQHSTALVDNIARLGKPALAVGRTVLSGVTSLVTVLFMSLFVLLEAPRIRSGILRLVRADRVEFAERMIAEMSQQVTGFMLANFATSVIAGVIVYGALAITGVPYAFVLSIWVALVDFLPLVGGLLAGVPVVGVAFLHSVTAGIVTLVVFLVYQQVENHLLNPIIISRTVRLNPLWVLLAVVFGAETGAIVGSTFGAICGAIFGVPVAGAVQVALRDLVAAGVILRRGRPPIAESEAPHG